MSASNYLETEILDLIFTANGIPDLADNDQTSPATALFVALHTADPGEAGTATTNEATYTSYARVSVARTSGGWTVSGNSAVNAAAVTFPESTGGSNTITHFSITTASSGSSVILFSGALSASLVVTSGITPTFSAGNLSVTAD